MFLLLLGVRTPRLRERRTVAERRERRRQLAAEEKSHTRLRARRLRRLAARALQRSLPRLGALAANPDWRQGCGQITSARYARQTKRPAVTSPLPRRVRGIFTSFAPPRHGTSSCQMA